jgi:RsiW-degrading membrane proteinase PrsW (M82 family)
LNKLRRHESVLLLLLIVEAECDCIERTAVTRTNTLYLVIGALALAVVVLAYQLYQDRQQPKGVHIDVGPGGLSIQGK